MPIIDWSKAHSGYELPAKVAHGDRNNEMHRYLSSLRGKTVQFFLFHTDPPNTSVHSITY